MKKKEKKTFTFHQPKPMVVGDYKVELIVSDIVEGEEVSWDILLNGEKFYMVGIYVTNVEDHKNTVFDFWGDKGLGRGKKSEENHEFKIRQEGYYFYISNFVGNQETKELGIDKAAMVLLFKAVKGVINTIIVRASMFTMATADYYKEMGFKVIFDWAKNQTFMVYQFKPFTSLRFVELNIGDTLYYVQPTICGCYKVEELTIIKKRLDEFECVNQENSKWYIRINKVHLNKSLIVYDEVNGVYVSTDKSLVLGMLLTKMRDNTEAALKAMYGMSSAIKHLKENKEFDFESDISENWKEMQEVFNILKTRLC